MERGWWGASFKNVSRENEERPYFACSLLSERLKRLLRRLTLYPGGVGLVIFWVGMRRQGLQIGTPGPLLKKISPKIDTPFKKWANFLYPVLEFVLKLIPRSRKMGQFFILRSRKFVN